MTAEQAEQEVDSDKTKLHEDEVDEASAHANYTAHATQYHAAASNHSSPITAEEDEAKMDTDDAIVDYYKNETKHEEAEVKGDEHEEVDADEKTLKEDEADEASARANFTADATQYHAADSNSSDPVTANEDAAVMDTDEAVMDYYRNETTHDEAEVEHDEDQEEGSSTGIDIGMDADEFMSDMGIPASKRQHKAEFLKDMEISSDMGIPASKRQHKAEFLKDMEISPSPEDA